MIDGVQRFEVSGTITKTVGSNYAHYQAGTSVDTGFLHYRVNNNNGSVRVLLASDANGRRQAELACNQQGFNVTPESTWRFSHSNGGWSWQEAFRTTIGSPPGIYVSGDSSAVSHTNRCSATLKREIGAAPVPSLLEHLRPTTFKMIPPTITDEDGAPLAEQPAPHPFCEQTRVGFIAEELAANPATASLINHADDPEQMGIDLGQMVALLTAELQRMSERLAMLEQSM